MAIWCFTMKPLPPLETIFFEVQLFSIAEHPHCLATARSRNVKRRQAPLLRSSFVRQEKFSNGGNRIRLLQLAHWLTSSVRLLHSCDSNSRKACTNSLPVLRKRTWNRRKKRRQIGRA